MPVRPLKNRTVSGKIEAVRKKGGARVGYILKQFDIPLLQFDVVGNTATPRLRIEWVNEERQALLPLDLAPSRRTAPMSTRCWPGAA